jgi:hypothetical protein
VGECGQPSVGVDTTWWASSPPNALRANVSDCQGDTSTAYLERPVGDDAGAPRWCVSFTFVLDYATCSSPEPGAVTCGIARIATSNGSAFVDIVLLESGLGLRSSDSPALAPLEPRDSDGGRASLTANAGYQIRLDLDARLSPPTGRLSLTDGTGHA